MPVKLSDPFTFYLLYFPQLCLTFNGVPQIPVFPKFKLPRTISQEAPVDPRWNSSLDGGGDGIGRFFHRTHERSHALQPAGLRASLPAGY